MVRVALGFRCFHVSQQQQQVENINDKLTCLCRSGKLKQALDVLWRTQSRLHSETYSLLVQECIFHKEFDHGKRIHAHMLSIGSLPDHHLHTKLIILYAKSGDLHTAHTLFDQIPNPTLISWNAIISGYVQNGLQHLAMRCYRTMRAAGFTPDQFTFASVFRACAALPTLHQGKQAHALMFKTHIRNNVVVTTALIDMYFKCSSPCDARMVFDESLERNVVTWTSLIAGYGHNGRLEQVFELFTRMIQEGFKPNHVTFLALLAACSHAGLVTEGQRYFASMTHEYAITPRLKHYALMVDLLGRAGRLNEAYRFILNSPCQKHSVVWGALLGAGRMHGDLDLVKIAAEKFFELEPENSGKYVVLSNTYAACGLWKNVKEVREAMKESGVKKETACSWIEIRGEVHTFLVRDGSHQQSEQIYETMEDLTCILKDVDYVPDLICW